MNPNELRRHVKARMRASGLSARGLMRELGLSEGNTTNLLRFLAGSQPPGDCLLEALGFRRESVEKYISKA